MPSKPEENPGAWLITGCSSGIGRHIALAALARGHNVAVTARNPTVVGDIVAEHRDRAVALALDVTDRDQVAHAVGETERAFGGVDVLVNNAGYGYMAAVEEGEDDAVRAMFDTNYFGVVEMIKTTLPGMRRRGRGHIINISSMTGLVANPPNVYYSSTKFALEALTEGLAKEVAPFGIRVTAIEPGAFRTDMVAGIERAFTQAESETTRFAPVIRALKGLAGKQGKFAHDPDILAQTIDHALTVKRPKPVYSVKADPLRSTLEKLPLRAIDRVYLTVLRRGQKAAS